MGILEALIGLLFIFWLIGLFFHIAGGLIHILLVVAVVLFVVRMLRGQSRQT